MRRIETEQMCFLRAGACRKQRTVAIMEEESENMMNIITKRKYMSKAFR
jgi:hypothetical protein